MMNVQYVPACRLQITIKKISHEEYLLIITFSHIILYKLIKSDLTAIILANS